MTMLSMFVVLADMPENVEVNKAECAIAQSIANGLYALGFPTNVIVTMTNQYEGQSVIAYSPNCVQATPVESFGVTSAPVDAVAEPVAVAPVFIASSISQPVAAPVLVTTPIVAVPIKPLL